MRNGAIEVFDTKELVPSLVDNDRVDIRVWLKGDDYEGPTRKRVRFYLFDRVWKEFKKLMSKVDREYQEIT